MKKCLKCKQTKPFSDFYKDRKAQDGLQSWCKTCKNAYKKAYRRTPKGSANHRKEVARYRRTPKGKANYAKYYKSVNGKATMKRFNARHPNYVKAHNAVNQAITAGRLSRPNSLPCHYCHSLAQEYHHYRGYEPEHWLNVVPVCRKCHSKSRRKIA